MIILGKDCLLMFYENGQWYPYACARSASIVTNTDTVETSVTGSGVFETSKPTKNSWSGTLEGIASLAETGMLTLPDIRARQLGQVLMLLRFQRTDQAGNVYTDEGSIYFTSVTDTNSFDNLCTFNAAFKGTGPLSQIFTTTPQPLPLVYRYEKTASGGETSFIFDGTSGTRDLRNKDIISFVKDGIGFSKIVTGTPASKEVKYVAATGEFAFAIPCEPLEEIYVLYQNI